MGYLKGYLPHILQHFCPWAGSERETLLEVFGIIRWLHQETDLHFGWWRGHTESLDHTSLVFCTCWKVQHLAQSMLNSSTLKASWLLETMLVTCNRMGFPGCTPCSLIGSCKLWSQEESTRNLCIITGYVLHHMWSHFFFIRISCFPMFSSYYVLYVCGQFKFRENFYCVPAQALPYVIFTVILWSRCYQYPHFTEEETETQRSGISVRSPSM